MLATKLSFRWPQCARTDLKKIIPSSNNEGVDLISATLLWDPKRRPNTTQVFSMIDVCVPLILLSSFQCLKHSYFKVGQGLRSSTDDYDTNDIEPYRVGSGQSKDSKERQSGKWTNSGVKDEAFSRYETQSQVNHDHVSFRRQQRRLQTMTLMSSMHC
jgi:hypothetical protein